MGVLIVAVVLVAIAVVVGVVLYLRLRLVRDPFAPGRQRRVAGAVLIGSVVVMFGSIIAARVLSDTPVARLSVLGYVMLAVFLYLVLSLVVLELPRLALDRWGGQPHEHDHPHDHDHPHEHVDEGRRRTIARILAGTAGVVAVGTTAFGYVQARTIKVKRVTVPMTRPDPAVDGLRIAVLTDLHLTPGMREEPWMAETVRRVNELDVDLVALVGDLVDGSVEELGDDAAPLADLEATYGVAFVTGNHEYISGAQQWAEFLPTLGIEVLRNRRIELDRNGATFSLAGVDDVTGGRYDGGPDFAAALDGRDADQTVILLAHQPVLADEARDNGVDLQISGHTHGGQLWPFHYLVQLQQGHLAGLERLGDTVLYTSRGVGSWGPPVRVGAPPEITLLTLEAR
jgi:predicted MPP superfamily phosphohydrolase